MIRSAFGALLLWCSVAAAGTPPLVVSVQTALAAGKLADALLELRQYRAAHGAGPEYIEAYSWIGRAQLAARNFSAAEANAADVRALCLAQLKNRKLDADASLPNALGASIEVQAMSAAGQGRRGEAVVFLTAELRQWGSTSIHNRIQKDLNLLTLKGRPAPPLDLVSLADERGHPVLLFFWAHWCSDCKQEIPIVQSIRKRFAPAGLALIAPTQHYGYTAGGLDASREVESRYIREVWTKFYAGLGPVKTPVSERNFARYGVSTTPTLVLLDAHGIVRIYHPGAMSEADLAAAVTAALQPQPR